MKLKYVLPYLLAVIPFATMSAKNIKDPVKPITVIGLSNGVYNAVVDINGSGDYTSVQKAIDAAPEGSTKPFLIFIKNGSYNEVIVVPKEKTFLHLIGQDKNKTIIHYKLNVQSQPKEDSKWYQNDTAAWKYSVHNAEAKTYKFPGQVVTVNAQNFYAENISFVNDWGVESQNGPQSLAMSTQADRIAFNNCVFRSFQDTWMTSTRGLNNRLYATNCWIEGAVDYFYGGGNAYVENSTFYNVRSGSVIVAPSHKEGTKWGYIFDHCIIDGNAAAGDGKLKLGRPWHDQPIAIYMNSTMKVIPHPEGWTDMGTIAKMFAEYNSRDVNGKLIDLSNRRTWYVRRSDGQRVDGLTAALTAKDVEKYTYKNIIEDADGWNPRSFLATAAKPTSLKISAGNLSWKAADKAAGYIIYKNNQVAGFSKAPSYDISKTGSGNYFVQSVNEFGSLGKMSDTISIK